MMSELSRTPYEFIGFLLNAYSSDSDNTSQHSMHASCSISRYTYRIPFMITSTVSHIQYSAVFCPRMPCFTALIYTVCTVYIQYVYGVLHHGHMTARCDAEKIAAAFAASEIPKDLEERTRKNARATSRTAAIPCAPQSWLPLFPGTGGLVCPT